MVTQKGKPKRRLYIDEWQSRRGFSDEEMAERIGLSARNSFWRWKNLQTRLDPIKIEMIADALGIEPEDLWRHPDRPSIDSLLKDADDTLLEKARDIVTRLVRP
jgi:transcriptional regulator with XRE-family HTH domain